MGPPSWLRQACADFQEILDLEVGFRVQGLGFTSSIPMICCCREDRVEFRLLLLLLLLPRCCCSSETEAQKGTEREGAKETEQGMRHRAMKQ